MPDVITKEERALIDDALAKTPASERRVPAGRSGLPRIFWDGWNLRVDVQIAGWRGIRAMQSRGGVAAGLAAQRRVADRNLRICEDARRGLTYPELVEKYELSRAAIYNVVSYAGVCVSPVARDFTSSDALTAKIVSLVDGVRTVGHIAHLAGCSHRSVRDRRDKMHLDIPKGKAGQRADYLQEQS